MFKDVEIFDAESGSKLKLPICLPVSKMNFLVVNRIAEQLLTPQQVSEWLQVKLSTIYKWTAIGYIPYVKLGGKTRGSVRFQPGEVERWIKRRSRRGRNSYRLDVGQIFQNTSM
jgi:excisionase family DNA binding protein